MSLDILIGYTGLASLGHAAFFAVGAYTTAILTTRYQTAFGSTLFFSILSAAGVSALLAPLALRAAGIYFLMITLAIAMCVWGLAYRWVSLTGGDNGITGIPPARLGIVARDDQHGLFLLPDPGDLRGLPSPALPPDPLSLRKDAGRDPRQ